jgi:hypothetical protein
MPRRALCPAPEEFINGGADRQNKAVSRLAGDERGQSRQPAVSDAIRAGSQLGMPLNIFGAARTRSATGSALRWRSWSAFPSDAIGDSYAARRDERRLFLLNIQRNHTDIPAMFVVY